MEFKVLAAGV